MSYYNITFSTNTLSLLIIIIVAIKSDTLYLLLQNLECAAVHSESRRGAAVNECNEPLATWMKAALVVPKQQGLAFVVVEREDGSRSGETAPGRSRGRRQ